jgi:hypothetical protein
MLKTAIRALAIGAVMSAASVANALVIDNFTTLQSGISDFDVDGIGAFSSASTLGNDILGGQRDLFLINRVNTTPTNVLSGSSSVEVLNDVDLGNVLRLNMGGGAGGTLVVRWDGANTASGTDDPTLGLAAANARVANFLSTVDSATGFGATDFASAGNAFNFALEDVTLFNFSFQVFAYSAAGASFVQAVASPALIGQPIPFIDFVPVGLTGVDWGAVTALQVVINFGNTDTGVVDAVRGINLAIGTVNVIPTPGVLALAGLALLAAGVASRRRVV